MITQFIFNQNPASQSTKHTPLGRGRSRMRWDLTRLLLKAEKPKQETVKTKLLWWMQVTNSLEDMFACCHLYDAWSLWCHLYGALVFLYIFMRCIFSEVQKYETKNRETPAMSTVFLTSPVCCDWISRTSGHSQLSQKLEKIIWIYKIYQFIGSTSWASQIQRQFLIIV